MITDSDDDPSRPRSDSKPESESAGRSRTADGLGYFRLGLGVKPNRVFNMNSKSRTRKLKQERIVTSGGQFEETKTKIMIH